MPKIAIKTLPLKAPDRVPHTIWALARVLEEKFDFQPCQFVITWEYFCAGHFLYNGQLADIQPSTTHHPIVEITAIEGMPTAKEQAMVRSLAAILSRELGIDDTNICCVINTLGSGKLFVMGMFKQAPVPDIS